MDGSHGTIEVEIEHWPKPMADAFFMQVGMMEAHDDQSTPTGSVVIDRGEMTVTTAAYTITGTGVGKTKIVVTHLWQRQRGVDSLPRFSQWCDPNTAAAIGRFLDAHDLARPARWIAFCKEGGFGLDYRKRYNPMGGG